MKIVLIDNYDSFTYNLYQYVGELMETTRQAFTLDVVRNDEITVKEISSKKYQRVIISPGPGSPDDVAYFGVCADVLLKTGKKTPVLGVCLGMQGMAHYFGGTVKRAALPMHGKTSIIQHDSKGVFRNLPQGIEVMRYHSLVADLATLSDELEITATVVTKQSKNIKTSIREIPYTHKNMEGLNPHMLHREPHQLIEIMGLRHKQYPIEGIQFHPESFATEGGKQIITNFLFQK